MATHWLRLWHDMPNDPKWRTIARASSQPISTVIAVYVHMLVEASANATERGRTQPNAEDLASALDVDADGIVRILAEMEGRVIDHGHLTGWKCRQPEREDGSSERSRAWRKKQEELKAQADAANATERNRTQKNTDKEEIKIKKEPTPKATPSTFELPVWVPKEPWDAWLEVRRKKRAANTERALRLAVRELDKLRACGESVEAVLDQSTLKSWTGLFPVKGISAPAPPAGPKPKTQYELAAEAQRLERQQAMHLVGVQ